MLLPGEALVSESFVRESAEAMYKVQKNHGSAGVDHMPVTKLSELMSIDKEELTAKVRSGKYLPQAILGVGISKGEGKTRLLGIPTVTDRLLQQAVLPLTFLVIAYHRLSLFSRHDIYQQFTFVNHTS